MTTGRLLSALTPWLGITGAFFACGCRSKPAPRETPAAPSAQSSARASPTGRCRVASDSAVVGIGKIAEGKRPGIDEDELAAAMPFSVELGDARAAGDRFAVGGLESRSGTAHAIAAILDEDGGGRTVELGRVFGDVDPPVLAPHRGRWLGAIAERDAAGVRLRLVRLDPPFAAADVRRGAEITGLLRHAPGFALESSEDGVLLAWTTQEKGAYALATAALDPAAIAPKQVHRRAFSADVEIESPRLAPRPGGYFLAYLVRQATASTVPVSPEEGADIVGEGPTRVEILPIDAKGVAVSSPKRVTRAGARVLAFDLLPVGRGGALVVYRDDSGGPGLEQPNVETVLMNADGTTRSGTWNVGSGVGLPAVLVDRYATAEAPKGWIVVQGESEARAAPLPADPLAPLELAPEPAFAGAEAVALLGRRVLRARTRGTRVELEVLACF